MVRWARVLELALAAWLIASPTCFDRADWLAPGLGAVLAILATWSLLRPDARIHLWELLPATSMVAVGWAETRAGAGEAVAAAQNLIVVGLLAATFCIVPTRANAPPPAWRGDRR